MKDINNQQDDRILAMRQVIRQLRLNDLNEGHCFMIFDDDLPDEQAYYEYPDGHIKIEQINKTNLNAQRKVIRSLSGDEIAELKEKHEVFRQAEIK